MSAKVANEKHAAFPGHFPGADWPLAVVQIDHTKFDIMLVDDIHRLCIGRPWVTLAIDVFSRMVVGIFISLDPPNSMSVGLCIAHAILPKEQWLARLDLSTGWPCWGVMQRIHADNGREFRGNMLQRACKEYNIDLEWRPVKTPHYGAHIERLLGTFNQEIHSLPGTTFSSPTERGEYNSEGQAVMTLAEFEKWIVTYITGVYHQREHSSLMTSPIQQYEKGILGTQEILGRGLPRRIVDEDRLRLDLMPSFEPLKAALYRSYLIDLPIDYLPDKTLIFERLNLLQRRTLLQAVNCLLQNWPDSFIEFCQAHNLASHFLIGDHKKDLPFWYLRVVRI